MITKIISYKCECGGTIVIRDPKTIAEIERGQRVRCNKCSSKSPEEYCRGHWE